LPGTAKAKFAGYRHSSKKMQQLGIYPYIHRGFLRALEPKLKSIKQNTSRSRPGGLFALFAKEEVQSLNTFLKLSRTNREPTVADYKAYHPEENNPHDKP